MTVGFAAEEKLAVMTQEQVEAEGLCILSDLRVYRRTKGRIVASVPVAPRTSSASGLLHDRDESDLPPLDQIRAMADWMLTYGRETLVWIGKDRKEPNTWHFMVPDQVGTGASVDYDDPDGSTAATLAAKARWIGSIHSHPGNSSSPSGVDIDNWRKGDCSGFHYIVARDYSYTLCAVVGGCTWTLRTGQLPDEAADVGYDTAGGKPLDEILREPKYTTPTYSYGKHWWDDHDDWPSRYRGGETIDSGDNFWPRRDAERQARHRPQVSAIVVPTHDAWGRKLSKRERKALRKAENAKQQAADTRLWRPGSDLVLTGDALVDELRLLGCVELTTDHDEFSVIFVGDRAFIAPRDVDVKQLELDTSTKIDSVCYGVANFEKGECDVCPDFLFS